MKKIILLFLLVLTGLAAAFTLWAYTPLGPEPQAEAALQESPVVQVDTSPWLVFSPKDATPSTGLIFYPGGRVDPAAYAPAMQAIAEQGYLAVIVPMPFNLAVFGIQRAAEVMDAYPSIEHWALAGHSLGGSMAASFAAGSPEDVQGLVLWASFPADGDNLSNSNLKVASIFGTEDGLVSDQKLEQSRDLLPASTTWAPIQGGNHAQFGYYGPQSGDNPAQISHEEQQAQVIAATVAVLATLEDGAE